MAATAALAALPLSSPHVSYPRPLPCRHRRTEAARSISCRASLGLGSDGSLSALAAPRTAPPRARTYLREHSCLLFPPPLGRRPLAVVKFLGGAFIGAVPEVTYGYLLELLAQEGFLVVSVPYNVTFDHAAATREVFERFHSCYDALLASGLPEAGLSALDIAELPLYSVGHSNGALLQLLVGSYFSEKIPKAGFGGCSLLRAGDAWKALFDLAGGLIQEFDQEAVVSLSKFVDQLPLVMNQVTEGVSEFIPTPPENREFCKNSYSVPKTLLVKFSIDAIDDTDIVEDILKPRVDSVGGQIKKIILSGTHLTPCIQDVKWQVGSEYTPADAVAQGLKSLALKETRVLARTIADWFRSL